MRTSIRRIFSLGIVVLFIAQYSSIAQTITSTAAGGNWEASSTWTGGIVPSAGTDVVIVGPVGFATGSGYSCRNLTVNSGGSLFNRTGYAWPHQILTVNGSVTNYGTIRNEGSIGLVLRIKGNISNNGAWTFQRTELTGTGSQTISAGSSSRFDNYNMLVDTTTRPALVAGSNLSFSCPFDLSKTTLDMKSYTMTLFGNNPYVTNGTILNAKDIVAVPSHDASYAYYPILENITYDGAPNIKGRVQINSLVSLKGTVTITDTLENSSGYSHPEKILKIVGTVTNNGIIRSLYSYGLALNVTGNITNNGTWAHNRTELSGSSDQILTLGAGKQFDASFSVTDSTLGMIVAGSDLAFTQGFNLGKATLDMKNFAITLTGYGTNISNGNVNNTKDLVGKPAAGASYPYLDNITYNGNPNIKGRLEIHTFVVMKGNVTVTDTLENLSGYSHPEKILKIIGNITNNGIIRNYYSYGLALNVTGNVTNNGTWAHNRTELSGNSDQILTLAAGKRFEASFSVTDSTLGMIVAGSDLAFTQGFNLSKATLDMKNFAITLTGYGTNIYNGSVVNTKDLIGKPAAGASYPYLDNITYNGNPNIKGRLEIHTFVVMKGNVTVTDTLENLSGYSHPEKILKIIGNITNNGIIRNYYSYGLALNVTGNVTNNGTWAHNRTELSGSDSQVLTLGAGSVFEAHFSVTDSLGFIVAGSDLVFTGLFNLNKCVFDAKSFALTLKGEGSNIYNGTVMNAKDVIGRIVNDYPVVDNITYDGKINLKGILKFNSGTLRGDVTVTDTIQNSSGYAHPEKFLKVIGNLANNGVVRDGGSAGFVLDVTGSITANKSIANKRVQLAGSGNRTIYDKLSQTSYYSTGDNVVLFGENYLPNLTISSGSKCLLANGSSIHIPNNTIDENLDNWSVIPIANKTTSAQSYSFFKARITLGSSTNLDSIKVSTYGHLVPSTFANAVRTWYRIDRIPKTASATISSFTMYYRHDELGQNVESNLQVFYSADSGKTWQQVSSVANLTRNADQNYVSITGAPAGGDFILSSSPDPVSVRPSIIVSIIGRPQIRYGAPNRFTINYVNGSDFPTNDFLISVNGNPGIRMLSAEITVANGRKVTIPRDSLVYDGQDSSAVFYVAGMGPREERNFDVIATADPGIPKVNKIDKVLSGHNGLTAGAVLEHAAEEGLTLAGEEAINYAGDYVKEKTWTEEQSKAWTGYVGVTKEELEAQEHKEGWKEWGVKQVVGRVVAKVTGVPHPIIAIADAMVQNVAKIIPNLRRRIWLAIYEDLDPSKDGNYNLEVSGKTSKELQRVQSCDPNVKIGPDGFGSQQFISTVGRMNYQILFENKKDATAPAYRIIVVDTLQADFDTSSVVFGSKSHDGPAYNWQMTKNGRILRWEIVGIELPPNVNPPEGEGYVTFSVIPKSGLASGTVLKNTATITFDVNAPIRTNQVVNALDFTAPTTVMKAIPQKLSSNKIVVKWQSTDGTNGSGVESASVFASKDSGPYLAVGTTNTDSLVVSLDPGSHKYSFYAIAKDNVGNVESARPDPVSSDIVNGVADQPVLPTEFSLSQNYPNPFNPSTTIEFSLASKVRATLKIFDLLGREMATLVDEEKSAGRYSIRWDASRLSSGVYFYRLTAGDFVQSRRLLLLK